MKPGSPPRLPADHDDRADCERQLSPPGVKSAGPVTVSIEQIKSVESASSASTNSLATKVAVSSGGVADLHDVERQTAAVESVLDGDGVRALLVIEIGDGAFDRRQPIVHVAVVDAGVVRPGLEEVVELAQHDSREHETQYRCRQRGDGQQEAGSDEALATGLVAPDAPAGDAAEHDGDDRAHDAEHEDERQPRHQQRTETDAERGERQPAAVRRVELRHRRHRGRNGRLHEALTCDGHVAGPPLTVVVPEVVAAGGVGVPAGAGRGRFHRPDATGTGARRPVWVLRRRLVRCASVHRLP